ncbi:MAG: sodium-dependent phosphate cotransporter [Planctomycetota bacterium]|jgi:sodium-dependent phosphate cotransporter
MAAKNPQLEPLSGRGVDPPNGAEKWLRFLLLFVLLFGFLVSIEMMSKAIKALADTGLLGETEGEIFGGITNPFAGLAIGVLFTVLVQSSSTTTATIVAVVGSGALSVESAVPMIMGANIGTTITNTLVSLGSVRRSIEFKRAFAAATVHDFFNILCVVIFLPLELATGALSKSAFWLTARLGGGGGAEIGKSPIKNAIKGMHQFLTDLLEGVGFTGKGLEIAALVLGIALTFLSLYLITSNMRRVLAGNIERAMNRALSASGFVPIIIGIVMTVAVQSSSITTSLLVPMCAAGVLSLPNAFPVMLGANIGTTVTALLASMAQERSEALTIALVHLLFNLSGVALFFPFKTLREIPIRLAMGLAELTLRSRWWILIYVLGTFVLIPISGWLLWGGN